MDHVTHALLADIEVAEAMEAHRRDELKTAEKNRIIVARRYHQPVAADLLAIVNVTRKLRTQNTWPT
ncbi:hypothetical protein [Mycobacterium lepromatosis]|uniref:hypothetical protein n=1 Tax=Mycobacterium lepromatosis TaxID=480418 RepID=UPI0005F7EDF9|nr:hypothetical protein [Mycobacterium lepromatosis]